MSAYSPPITSEEAIDPLCKEETISNPYLKIPVSVHYVVDPPMRSKDDVSEYGGTTASDSLFDLSQMNKGRHSPPPSNDILAGARNERRYRLLLEHQFHPSRKLSIGVSGSIKLNQVGILTSYIAALEPSHRRAWRRWLPF